jgi:hypothetical protein
MYKLSSPFGDEASFGLYILASKPNIVIYAIVYNIRFVFNILMFLLLHTLDVMLCNHEVLHTI